MFAYCNNNPAVFRDTSGTFPRWAIGALVGGIVGAISAAVTGGDLKSILINAAAGAVSGAILATTLNHRLARKVASGIVGTLTTVDCLRNGADLGTSVFCGVAAATITYGTSSLSGICGGDTIGSLIIDSTFGLGGAIISSTISMGATEISKQRNSRPTPSTIKMPPIFGGALSAATSQYRGIPYICVF